MPYFPLGGFTPLQSSELDDVAKELGASPMQVAQAWLLQRYVADSGDIFSSPPAENLAAAKLELSAETVAKLNAIGDAA